MEMISESYRGMSLVVEVVADRVLVPLAVVVALIGAAMIGVELTEMFAPKIESSSQL